jgi:hypothetical protein
MNGVFNWHAYYDLARERQREMLREAEKNRLVRQVQAGRGRQQRFYSRALTGLGSRLVLWGCRLQTRYASPFQAANCTR